MHAAGRLLLQCIWCMPISACTPPGFSCLPHAAAGVLDQQKVFAAGRAEHAVQLMAD